MTKNTRQKLKDALIKKAVGYVSKEWVDELVVDPDTQEMKIVKRKVTKKQIAPDLSAAKLLFEITGDKTYDLSSMSDDDLQNERQKLLQMIGENDDKNL